MKHLSSTLKNAEQGRFKHLNKDESLLLLGALVFIKIIKIMSLSTGN